MSTSVQRLFSECSAQVDLQHESQFSALNWIAVIAWNFVWVINKETLNEYKDTCIKSSSKGSNYLGMVISIFDMIVTTDKPSLWYLVGATFREKSVSCHRAMRNGVSSLSLAKGGSKRCETLSEAQRRFFKILALISNIFHPDKWWLSLQILGQKKPDKTECLYPCWCFSQISNLLLSDPMKPWETYQLLPQRLDRRQTSQFHGKQANFISVFKTFSFYWPWYE